MKREMEGVMPFWEQSKQANFWWGFSTPSLLVVFVEMDG